MKRTKIGKTLTDFSKNATHLDEDTRKRADALVKKWRDQFRNEQKGQQ